VEQQLVEDALQEGQVAPAAAVLAVHLEDAPGRPGVDRRVDGAELPLLRRQLAVGGDVTDRRQPDPLGLWGLPIEHRQRDAVGGSGGRGPTRRTRGTPTCRAWR